MVDMAYEDDFEWWLVLHQEYLRNTGKQEKDQLKKVPEFLLSLEIIKILSREVSASHSARNDLVHGRRARLFLSPLARQRSRRL